jgi:hypothetical protein
LDNTDLIGMLCDQYLPRVLRYVCCWVKDLALAEELTIAALQQALVEYGTCCQDESRFSLGIFRCAVAETHNYLKAHSARPLFPALSAQEQDVLSLRLAAPLSNRLIADILGLAESQVCVIVRRSLGKMADLRGVPG